MTGVNGTPGIVNGSIDAYGYLGSGRKNNIRRKTQLKKAAAHTKPDTTDVATLPAMGEFSVLSLQPSDRPGAVSLTYFSESNKTETLAYSGLGPRVAIAVYNGNVIMVPADGMGSSGTIDASLTNLRGNGGDKSSSMLTCLVTGDKNSKYIRGRRYIFDDAQEKSSIADSIVFDKRLSVDEVASLDALLAVRIAR